MGDHGAVRMEDQERILAGLLPGTLPSTPPGGIDPAAWKAAIPEDNGLTQQRVDLGRKLFFDLRLSQDKTVSCATCHDVTRGFTDQRPVSEGIGGKNGKRNAPTAMNAALLQTLFLDGRSPSVDHQARMPILNPIEMGMPNEEAAVNAIRGDPLYQAAFKDAYGREVNYQDIGRAIGAFERTLIFIDSPMHRYLKGKTDAVSADVRAGWVLFNGKARCVTCHPLSPSNPLGTDNRFHNVGVSARHQDFEGLARKAIKTMQEDPSEKKLDELSLGTDLGELGRFMVTRSRAEAPVANN